MTVPGTRMLLALLVIAIGSPRARALQVIASDDMDHPVNRTSYSVSVDATTWNIHDWFGIGSVASFPHPDGVPQGLADDTMVNISGGGVLPIDTVGFIDGLRDPNDSFFAATDTDNVHHTGVVWAEWVFDVAGASNLSLSIDIAAMGNFEGPSDPTQPQPDRFDFTYALDGGAFSPLFTSSVDGVGDQDYTMQSGTSVTYDDPLMIDDGTGAVKLSDVFTAYTRAIPETGSSLTLRVEAYIDRAAEAVAFDNIVIMGSVGPAAPGDFDGDGDKDEADIDLYIGKFGHTVPPEDDKFDLVDDGVITADDYNFHALNLLEWANAGNGQSGTGTLRADFNRDGVVDLIDLDRLGASWQSNVGWNNGDTNGDGLVDLLDLDRLGSNWGQDVFVAPSAAPEPSASVFFCLAGLGLLSRRGCGQAK